MIEREITITQPPEPDTIDVHPRGADTQCEFLMNQHVFFIVAIACGMRYQICGRCGTVRISDDRSR